MVLNVGDAVYRHARIGYELNRFEVAEVTSKLAILGNGVELKRDSDSTTYVEIDGDCESYLLETDELKMQFELRQKEYQRFYSLVSGFSKLSLAQLREINAMLAEAVEQKTA